MTAKSESMSANKPGAFELGNSMGASFRDGIVFRMVRLAVLAGCCEIENERVLMNRAIINTAMLAHVNIDVVSVVLSSFLSSCCCLLLIFLPKI